MRDALSVFQWIEICHSIMLLFNRKRIIPKNINILIFKLILIDSNKSDRS